MVPPTGSLVQYKRRKRKAARNHTVFDAYILDRRQSRVR
jgi:hypothetical protein